MLFIYSGVMEVVAGVVAVSIIVAEMQRNTNGLRVPTYQIVCRFYEFGQCL